MSRSKDNSMSQHLNEFYLEVKKNELELKL